MRPGLLKRLVQAVASIDRGLVAVGQRCCAARAQHELRETVRATTAPQPTDDRYAAAGPQRPRA